MTFWKKVFGVSGDKAANGSDRADAPESDQLSGQSPHSDTASTSVRDEGELPPVSSLVGVCCFVGSTTFRLSEADATKAYLMKNPTWPGKFRIAVIHADGPLKKTMSPEQACILACLDSIGSRIKKHSVVVQTLRIRSASGVPGDPIPICFASAFGPGNKTTVIQLDDDPIPY